jgi:hypothetical protein
MINYKKKIFNTYLDILSSKIYRKCIDDGLWLLESSHFIDASSSNIDGIKFEITKLSILKYSIVIRTKGKVNNTYLKLYTKPILFSKIIWLIYNINKRIEQKLAFREYQELIDSFTR